MMRHITAREMAGMIACLLFLAGGVACQSASEPTTPPTFFDQPLPGETPVVFAAGLVTYEFMNHSSVSISPDLDEMYWSKWYDAEGRQEVVFSKLVGGRWTAPETAAFSGVYSDDVPFLRPDGERLYFLSRRPLTPEARGGREYIWSCDRQPDGSWAEPQALPETVNSGQMHWQFSVAENGNIYFSTDDGMKLARLVEGAYQAPVLVTEALHAQYLGGMPYIAPDESYIIFNSGDLPGTVGRNDLYIGYRGEDGTWSEPIHLGEPINGPKGDMCPNLSPNGEWLFYVRHDDAFNIYWVEASFIEELRPD